MTSYFKRIITALLLSTCSLAKGYEAIIFDCDGVLVDTEYLKFQAWQAALKEKGISFTEVEYLPLVGHCSEYIAKAIQDQKQCQFDPKALIEKKEDIYHTRQKEGVPVLNNRVEFLKKIISQKKQWGLQLGLASAAPKEEILENLKQIHVNPEDFDVIASGKDDLQHVQDPEGVNKPKPYIYQFCAEKLKVCPDECLVFEDTNAGVEASFKAGMHVIAIPNKYTQGQNFSEAEEVVDFSTTNQNRLLETIKRESEDSLLKSVCPR